MNSIRCLFVTSLLLLGLGLPACRIVPETGRRQLSLLPVDQEMQLGLSAFQEIKEQLPISDDPEANALVQQVGQRIAAVADLPEAQWEFVVFENEQPNAFCLPGGKVGIFTGILPITQNEAGLATVIGHEVAHAAARHGAERVSEAILLQTGGGILGASLSSSDPAVQSAAATVYGLAAVVGRQLPHSRRQESEADYIGLLYMARAGYDPEESIRFWERFAEFNRRTPGATPAFLRTHPLDEDRIADLQSWLPEAKAQFQPAP